MKNFKWIIVCLCLLMITGLALLIEGFLIIVKGFDIVPLPLFLGTAVAFSVVFVLYVCNLVKAIQHS